MCGGIGQSCSRCACRESGSTCNGELGDQTCVACGALGQPCCMASQESPSAVPCTGTNLECEAAEDVCGPCGAPGEPCCGEGDPFCVGGCCTALSDGTSFCVANGSACAATDGLCTAGGCANCGREGQLCCQGRACSPHLTCTVDGHCTAACGGPGQPCCPGGVCTNGCCVEPTLNSANECVAIGDVCPGVAGACAADGSCGTCGGLGQPCCAFSPTDLTGLGYCAAPLSDCLEPAGSDSLELTDQFCQACGQRGLPCCGWGCQGGSVCNRQGMRSLCQ